MEIKIKNLPPFIDSLYLVVRKVKNSDNYIFERGFDNLEDAEDFADCIYNAIVVFNY